MSTTKKKTSWLTTFFGWLAGLSSLAALYPDPRVQKIAAGVSAASVAALGTAARDNHVSSEDAGAK